jgi:dTDP-4-amino-4,6-dideoxygalactose transaminase
MSADAIRYIKPVLPLPEEWLPYLRESYAAGYFANFGPAVKTFEQRLKEKYARGRAVVTAPNATNGLVAALQALGVKGKVLTPAYTFPATGQAILMAQCTPVFCDVSEDTWELAPDAVAQALRNPEIRAILHVRAYGFGHDLGWLEALAKGCGIPLVIDAAAAIGGEHSLAGKVGQQGTMEVFSFHATKVFGIGEGAALFSAPEHEQTLRTASNFGIRYPDVAGPGQNNKMSDFQAAVGLAILDKIDSFIQRRKAVVERYHQTLAGLDWISHAPDPDLSPWQSYPVRLRAGKNLKHIMERAAVLGLELKRGYYRPLHSTSYFSRFTHTDLPTTDAVSKEVICMPVYSDMPMDMAERVLQLFIDAAR